MTIIDWSLIAVSVLVVALTLWACARLLEPACYDDEPTNVDTLWRGNKCHNCMHSEIAIDYPQLACHWLGKNVEPTHSCPEWK